MSDLVCFLPDGEPVNIGLTAGIPMDTYHALPGFSSSQAKILRDRSPAHLRHYLDNRAPSTDAQRLGAAVHDAVLLPDLFGSAWVRRVEGNGATKAVKEARAQQVAENPEAVILPADDFDTCLAIRDSIAAHPKARRLLEGDAEQSALWFDEGTGVLCRGRFDLLSNRTPAVVDLKTTRDASFEKFGRSIYELGYHIQAAHYVDGAQALGYEHNRFIFIAVEKEPPYAVALYELGDESIRLGRSELEPLMSSYAWCSENDAWPAYPDTVQIIHLPHYAERQIEERVA